MDGLDSKIISPFLSSLLTEDCLLSSLGGLLVFRVFRAFRASPRSLSVSTHVVRKPQQQQQQQQQVCGGLITGKTSRRKKICWTEQDEDVLSVLFLIVLVEDNTFTDLWFLLLKTKTASVSDQSKHLNNVVVYSRFDLKVPCHKKTHFSGLYIYKLVLPEPAAQPLVPRSSYRLVRICSCPYVTTGVIIIVPPPLSGDRRNLRGKLHPRGEVQCVQQ